LIERIVNLANKIAHNNLELTPMPTYKSVRHCMTRLKYCVTSILNFLKTAVKIKCCFRYPMCDCTPAIVSEKEISILTYLFPALHFPNLLTHFAWLKLYMVDLNTGRRLN